MPSLLLVLTGPLQAWGTRSHHDTRDTGTTPTLSGVVGMLSAALGLPREQATRWVDPHLQLSVRTDQTGQIITDYHTINGDPEPGAALINYQGKAHQHPVQTYRQYLADFTFTVALTHPSTDLIDTLAHAIQHPIWAPALGRQACQPALPPYLGTVTQPLTKQFWSTLPLLTNADTDTGDRTVPLLLPADRPEHATHHLNDHPVAFGLRTRQHATRLVRATTITIPAHRCVGLGLHGHHQLRQHLATLHEQETPA